MKYYQIDVSCEPKIIGVNNGIYQIKIDKNIMQEDERFSEFLDFFSYDNKDFWQNQNTILNFKIPEIHGKLLKKAKLTDIMGYTESITFLNNVYSQKFIDILNIFNIEEYSLFKIDIENIASNYYFMFIKTIDFDEINFQKSVLYTGHKTLNNVQYFQTENYDDYLKTRQIQPLLRFEKISIPKKYSNLDVIETRCSANPYYSEKLIDALLDFGITGLDVKYNSAPELNFY
jgi:hypothetical protein